MTGVVFREHAKNKGPRCYFGTMLRGSECYEPKPLLCCAGIARLQFEQSPTSGASRPGGPNWVQKPLERMLNLALALGRFTYDFVADFEALLGIIFGYKWY